MPSCVLVPRPISSSTIRLRSVAARRTVGRLLHLDHEGRAPARQIVHGADAGEDAVHQPDARRLGRHERARLRQQHDQRDLAHPGALAGHVRAGQDRPPGRARRAPPAGRRSAGTARAPRRPGGARRRSRGASSSSIVGRTQPRSAATLRQRAAGIGGGQVARQVAGRPGGHGGGCGRSASTARRLGGHDPPRPSASPGVRVELRRGVALDLLQAAAPRPTRPGARVLAGTSRKSPWVLFCSSLTRARPGWRRSRST